MASAETAFDWLRHALLGAKSSVFGPKSFKFECSNSGFLLKPNHLVGFVCEFRVGMGKVDPFDWEIGESDLAGKLNRDRRIGTWRTRSDEYGPEPKYSRGIVRP